MSENCYINGLELKYEWQYLLQSLKQNSVGDRRGVNRVFLELVNAYSSDRRFYHGLDHIKYTLEIMASLKSQANNYPAIQLYAWFHDEIYNPKAKDN